MRRIATLFFVLSALAAVAFPKDVYLSIGGSVGVFRTDMRLFNPASHDITVQAYLLPIGGVDNSGVQPKAITVHARQQAVYDDVVTSLFQSSGLAGIRLSSTDDFVATQRIYAATSTGTLGQFVGGIDSASAKKNGVLIQLKSGPAAFRTNIGMVNPNSATANTTWRLYDKNNVLVGTPKQVALPPFAVISPQEMRGYLGAPSDADLSDAWIGYTSDQPIVAYASCVDNASTDPTYIPASEDTNPPSNNTTTPGTKTLNVVEHNNSITITGADQLILGDTVNVHVQVFDGPHGFELVGPDGKDVIPVHVAASPGAVYDAQFVVAKQGTYSYFCANTACGAHDGMFGSFAIGEGDKPPGYY